MKITSWGKYNKADPDLGQVHKWSVYMNPRNQKISLVACSKCGVLKGVTDGNSKCLGEASRASHMLVDKGWIKVKKAS